MFTPSALFESMVFQGLARYHVSQQQSCCENIEYDMGTKAYCLKKEC